MFTDYQINILGQIPAKTRGLYLKAQIMKVLWFTLNIWFIPNYLTLLLFWFFHICNSTSILDNICENSSNDAWNGHLVPHPFKSERFYICQFIGKGINKSTWEKLQWIAHLMECPEKTYFSIASKTCAWVLDNKR